MESKNIINQILSDAAVGGKITSDDAAILFKHADIYALGRTADTIRSARHPAKRVTFVIDRNINYTNICINRCDFCAFYRDNDSRDGYLLSKDDILRKIDEAVLSGATQIMMQGGLHPDLKIEYYTELFKIIKEKFNVVIHSLSPPEILYIANNSSLSVEETLNRLKDAGLDSLPGGGAEILSDRIRSKISPKKISADNWLMVMEAAHNAGFYSTATMMFGIGEEISERVEHLNRIRELQEKTGKFRAFIPWTFQPGHTEIGGAEVSAEDYLRTLSIARIFLHNIDNIQGSWLTQGEDIGQLSLLFGANDLGSIMLEENVVRSTGVHHTMNTNKIVKLINNTGFRPAQRDTKYNILKEF